MDPITYALIALFVPLAAAVVIAVVAPLRHRGSPASALSVTAALVSLFASIALFVQQLAQPDRVLREVVRCAEEHGPHFREEFTCVSSASRERQKQFSAGRECAHRCIGCP